MSYFQATTHKPHSALIAYKPEAGLGRTGELLRRHSLCPHSTRSHKLQDQVYPRLVLVSACHKRFGPVYALSGKDNPEIVNDLFSMESLNKAMAAKKQRSIQDLLMGQIAKIRGQGSGGNGGNKNRYGGGGGGSDGPDDKSFKDSLYELIQILLATVTFMLVVIALLHICFHGALF